MGFPFLLGISFPWSSLIWGRTPESKRTIATCCCHLKESDFVYCQITLVLACVIGNVGAGSASRMLLYLSCPELKPGEAESSLRQLNIERRHVNFDQLLIEGIFACGAAMTYVVHGRCIGI